MAAQTVKQAIDRDFDRVNILSRYLAREVVKPIAILFFILTAIFAAYSASEFLGKAAQGLIRVDTILTLVILKSIIAMEVLLPIATFLTVVIVLSRLGSNYEITAMAFCGFSRLRVLGALALVFVAIAVMVSVLSIWARPRVYAESYRIQAEAKKRLNLDDVQEGVFLSPDKGQTVIYIEPGRQKMQEGSSRNVFAFLERDADRRVIRASDVRQVEDASNGRSQLIFKNFETWQVEGKSDRMSMISEEISIPFQNGQAEQARIRKKALPTNALNRLSNPEHLAEYQWRLSRPFSTIILGFLAVGMSNFVPRRDRYARLIAAVVVYIVYFNLQALARTWVENGKVGAKPGLFWVDGLIAALLLILFIRSRIAQSRTA